MSKLDLGSYLRAAGHSPARIDAFLSTLDDVAAARFLQAIDDGDTRSVMKAFADQTWSMAPAKAAPAAAEPAGSRSPMSFEDRLMSDPNIRRALDEAGVEMPRDPEGVMEAYRGAAPKRGRPKQAKTNEDAIRQLRASNAIEKEFTAQAARAMDRERRASKVIDDVFAEDLAKPADQQAAEEIAGQFDRALIPYGTRGPGVPVGGVGGPGLPVSTETGLIVAPPRGLPYDPSATRALSVMDEPDALESASRELSVIPDESVVTFEDSPSRIAEPLPVEDPFAPAVSARPRIGYDGPRGPGVPVDGVARERPTGLVPTRRGTPGRGLEAAALGTAAAAGAAAYYGAPGEAKPAAKSKPEPTAEEVKLAAAAAPVTPDAEVGRPKKSERAKPEDPRAAYIAAHIEDGWTPEEAEKLADSEARRAGAFGSWDTPRARAISRQAAASHHASNARMDAFDQSLAAPSGIVPVANTVTVDGLTIPSFRGAGGVPLGDGQYYMERDRIAAERERADATRRAGGDHGVPGPRTDDGRPAELPPTFSTPEEADDYFTRKRDPKTGELMPSKADLAMRQRGFVPVYTPEGNISYSLAANYDGPGGVSDQMSPNARRHAGYYEGREVQMEDGSRPRIVMGADGRPVYDPRTGKPKIASWEGVDVETPFGPRRVLRMTDEARQANADRQRRNSLIRDAARGDQDSLAELKTLSPAERRRLRFEKQEQERKDLWQNSARLAGGSRNINSGNRKFFNALAMLEGVDPDQMDAQQQSMMQMMPMDPVRAQVEARQLDMAARLAGDAITGALAGREQDGMQAEVFRAQQADKAQDFFNQWHDRNFGWGTAYTQESRAQAIRMLMARFRLDYDTAAGIADSRPSAGGAAGQAPAVPGQRAPGTTAAGNPMPMTDGFDR